MRAASTGPKRISTLCAPPSKRPRDNTVASESKVCSSDSDSDDLQPSHKVEDMEEDFMSLLKTNDTVQKRMLDDVAFVRPFVLPPALEPENPSTDLYQLLAFFNLTGRDNTAGRATCVNMIGRFMHCMFQQELLPAVRACAPSTRAFFVQPCSNSRSSVERHRRYVVLNPPDGGADMQVLQANLCTCQRHHKANYKWREMPRATGSTLASVAFVCQLFFVLSLLWAEGPRQAFAINDQGPELWRRVAAAAAAAAATK